MVPWSGPAEFWNTGTSMTDMSGLKSLGTFLAQLYTKFEFINSFRTRDNESDGTVMFLLTVV